ncbi:hypothetical protein [Desulfotruncus arcticus]|uniref:hypothetical protein n=1 Tax=Desulfotruncus arcticus TaxID=341036 RepID=UPI001041CBCD|nr:hypothetical protein [Desulfotruncus arcticus]
MTNEEFQGLVLKQLQALTEGQKNLVEEQRNLAEGQKDLVEGQRNLAEGQARIESRMDKIESRMDKLESKVDQLEIRIEDEVINKIRVLFDANRLQDDRYNQVMLKLSDMDDKLDYVLLKVVKHDVQLLAQKKLAR